MTNALKPATTETGLVVQVPNFINAGDVIRVDTETGAYLQRGAKGRASSASPSSSASASPRTPAAPR